MEPVGSGGGSDSIPQAGCPPIRPATRAPVTATVDDTRAAARTNGARGEGAVIGPSFSQVRSGALPPDPTDVRRRRGILRVCTDIAEPGGDAPGARTICTAHCASEPD